MKTSEESETIIPSEFIEQRIFVIRGRKVILSTHLAELYDVEPRVLTQAVKRNAKRFPDDFMFQLNASEFHNLKSQIVISSYGGLRSLPYAFTEQGVAMLSSVLRRDRAIAVNIAIMRAFVRLRQLLANNKEFAEKLVEMEKKYDENFKIVFDALRQLMVPSPDEENEEPLGFRSQQV